MELYLGSCLDYLSRLGDKSVDNVFADLPYGNKTKYVGYDDSRENLTKLINKFMPEAFRVANKVIITPGNGNQYLYPPPTWTLAFVNKAGIGRSGWGFSCWQPILVYGNDPFLQDRKGARPDTYFMNGSGDNDKNTIHPCPKPFDVMEWIIWRTTRPGETVLDPFMGNGTTGVVCVKNNREFIGCELSEVYFELARKKIEEAASQPKLFEIDLDFRFQKEQLNLW